ncbi:putative protein OS=Tsukamurella paurometabola (strain ATCC 8368 / DSM / CCUG 35730 /CIP 100753 / JCM 10117 / KCTC 9821 / NBRC 16120 / NCIMB 702349/ NCTC 13040) OX=521096 GN=Tpau_0260 PE=4 SV=1 [Tsukamurella paurometabola]|uniref:Uncharacterized protein n=2 Tax=Tsukamurella paurometabola TaxID=2061 RepID=D5UQS7_TSUPD|nr:hypothetical protein Tpau_0260 [Tsukamurella paurometabola DSM 20162]SUP42169.1 Uncharacterised protein [Tsukamurella paurometabola]
MQGLNERSPDNGGEAVAAHLREVLDMLAAPALVREQVVFASSVRMWPPRPGWDRTPGIGSIRLWTDCDLLAWFDAAAADGVALFGQQSRDEIRALTQATAMARMCGEGAKAIWGLDVLGPGDYSPIPTSMKRVLWANDLVCFGPQLTEEQTAQIQAHLDDGHDGHGRQETNAPVAVHGTECFATVWMGGTA